MNWLISMLVGGLVAFSLGSAAKEIRLYRRAVRGEIQYLVSRARRNRRLLIAAFLLVEALLLFFGTFVLSLKNPGWTLLYWTPGLLLMIVVMLLAFQDFRETRRDMDRIFREAVQSAIKNVEKAKKS